MKVVKVHIFFALFLGVLIMPVRAEEVVTCGEFLLDVTVMQEREDTSILLRVLDKDRKLVFPVIRHPGAFLPLCKKGVFLLIDNSVHYLQGRSFLMTADSKVVASFEFGEIIAFGKSKDEEIFWIQYFDIKEKMPITVLTVYDITGEKIFSESFKKEKIFQIKKSNKKYDIKILKPDYPG